MVPPERIALAYNNVDLLEQGGVRLLIDTGPDFAGASAPLETGRAGREPEVVLATHAHVDHAGLGAYWAGRGVPVALEDADAPTVRAPAAAYLREVAMLEEWLAGSGAPAALAAEALAGL